MEQRWCQLQSLIQEKIRNSAQTLEDLARIQSKLKDACEGVKEHQPTVNSALKTSPPPDLAQSFLFEHLSACVELEARQQQLDHAISEAQSASSRLGLSEKRGLQELVDQAQTEVEALGADVAQRRKYLSKVYNCSYFDWMHVKIWSKNTYDKILFLLKCSSLGLHGEDTVHSRLG